MFQSRNFQLIPIILNYSTEETPGRIYSSFRDSDLAPRGGRRLDPRGLSWRVPDGIGETFSNLVVYTIVLRPGTRVQGVYVVTGLFPVPEIPVGPDASAKPRR